MLLQKTGWRIKQLISHHRNGSLEEYDENFRGSSDQNSPTLKVQTNGIKRASWISQSPTTGFQSPLRRASSTATTRSRPSPPINSTAHSSASSLCSCECATNPPSSNSLSVTPSRMEPRPEILYLPPVSSTASGDAKTWRLIFPEKPSCPARDPTWYSGKLSVRGSTFNLLEALTMDPDPVDNDRTPTQSIRNTDDSDLDSINENVEQLIRETDEAFHAVGEALADAKAATQRWHDDPAPKPISRNVSVSRGVFKKEARPPVAVTAVKSPITRTKSLAKTKRKGFYRKKNLLGRVRNVPPPPANTPAQWTLTDMTANMVGVFNGKMFRTEVDEILTPDRLRRLRQKKVESERKISVESARSVGTDGSTPTEPFHLESLSSRLAAAQLKEAITPPFPSPILPPPAVPQRRSSPGREGVRAGKAKVTVNDSGMEFQDLNFPSPPRNMSRSKACATSPLPTILEVSPLNFMSPQPPSGTSEHRQFSFESILSPPDYILLPSTSFTLTCPTFKQGPIRLEWMEKELLPDDEPLDWTAFQMAISGTMDEFGVDERDDIEWAADETEVDDILDWWDGYKFPGYGQMDPGDPPLKPKSAEAVAIKTQRRIPRCDSGTDKMAVVPTTQTGLLREVKKGYAESMPPSPMLAFVPPSSNKRDEFIPMGFNLGHDLGDFLDWEANYVRKYFVDD